MSSESNAGHLERPPLHVEASTTELDLTDLLQEIQLMPGGTRFYVPAG